MENKLLVFGISLVSSLALAQENEQPKVEIISPSDKVELKHNTIVPYRIAISDKEDGNSEYNEINENEVVLTLTYLSDPLTINTYVEEEVEPRSEMLSLIASSNCLTCHQAKNKLIGPSFEDIAKKYSSMNESKAYLTQKIRQGSRGIWSDEIMPGQPELDKEKIEQILDWIFINAQDPNYTFYTGAEGAFKTKEKQKDTLDKGVYVLHALYTDHGSNESFFESKKGTHSVVLKSE